MSVGFQTWDANGRALFRPADYTFRVLDEVEIPAMSSGPLVVYNQHCAVGKVRIYLAPRGIRLFAASPVWDGSGIGNMYKPRVTVGNGFFVLDLPGGFTPTPDMRAVIFAAPRP